FSLVIAWSGIAGISAYRIFAQVEPVSYNGECEKDETDEIRLLTRDGCGSDEAFSTLAGFTIYESTKSYSKGSETKEITAFSVISQADADRKALRAAIWYVLAANGEMVLTPSSAYEGIVPINPRITSITGGLFESLV